MGSKLKVAECTRWVVRASLRVVVDLPICLYALHRGENLGK